MRFAILFLAALFISNNVSAGIVPANLKCEDLTDPQGIDIPDPRFYWQIMVWDKNQQAPQWSAPARFTIGLLQDADWKNAEWIAWRPRISGRRHGGKGNSGNSSGIRRAFFKVLETR